MGFYSGGSAEDRNSRVNDTMAKALLAQIAQLQAQLEVVRLGQRELG